MKRGRGKGSKWGRRESKRNKKMRAMMKAKATIYFI